MEEAIILKYPYPERILHGRGSQQRCKAQAQADGGESGGHPEGGHRHV